MNARRLVAAFRARRAMHAVLLAAAVAPLAACGAADAPLDPTAVPPTPAAESRPAASDPSATPREGFGNDQIALGPVVWSLALDPATGGPAEAIAAVPVDAPRFWATAPLERATPGTRLRADWSYNGTAMPALAAEAVVPAGGGGWATFDLALPTGGQWPAGDYAVTISVDGQPAVRATIPVVAANS